MSSRGPTKSGADHARPRPVSLAHSMLYYGASYGFALAGYLWLNVAAARFLGTSDFGYFVVVLTVTALVGQQCLLGLHRAGLREAARADTNSMLAELRNGVKSVLTIAAPLAALATGAAAWQWYSGPHRVAVAGCTAALVFLSGYQVLSANFLRGLGHVRYASMLEGRSGGALVALGQALGVSGVAWVAPEWGLAGALGAAAAGYILPLLFAGLLLNRSWGHTSQRHRPLADLRGVARRDWRFAVAQAGAYVNSMLELWLAGLLLSAHATSLFAAALRLSQLVLIPATSLQVVFSPTIARLTTGTDRTRLQRLLRAGATVSTSLSTLAWLPLVIAPAFVLALAFGEGFEEAVPVLLLLSSGYLLHAASGPAAVTLSMSGHEGDVAAIHWTAVAVRLGAGIPCAYLWGIAGLAASATVVGATSFLALWWAARRRVAVSTHVTIHPDLALLRRVAG